MKALSATTATEALRNLLARTVKFAAKDDHAMGSVRLFEHDGVLHAVATDHYRVLVRRSERGGEEAEKVDEGFQVIIPTDDVKRLIQVLASYKKAPVPATVTLRLGDFPSAEIKSPAMGDQSITLRPLDVEYPNVLKLFRFELEPLDNVILNSRFMADIHVTAKQPTALLAFTKATPGGRSKPPVLFSADNFEIGMLMPISQPSGPGSRIDQLLDTWSWLKN